MSDNTHDRPDPIPQRVDDWLEQARETYLATPSSHLSTPEISELSRSGGKERLRTRRPLTAVLSAPGLALVATSLLLVVLSFGSWRSNDRFFGKASSVAIEVPQRVSGDSASAEDVLDAAVETRPVASAPSDTAGRSVARQPPDSASFQTAELRPSLAVKLPTAGSTLAAAGLRSPALPRLVPKAPQKPESFSPGRVLVRARQEVRRSIRPALAAGWMSPGPDSAEGNRDE